ncbi:MAG TPA: Gfo/Idh/MocA family oxidoreductase [Tepidisphaeraceae bacterium]|nr:Gfo/Idh/MocA family oxidoreductase [Tepidisphaeraceae bacterium]
MPTPRPSRRRVLASSAAALTAAGLLKTPHVWGADEKPAPKIAKTDKLRIAVIGCGGQGTGTHIPAALRENMVAICDPDPNRQNKALEAAASKAKLMKVDFDPAKVQRFDDYRRMFDALGNKQLDGILVATPNHHHALPALIAMKLGIAAYVEKPLCYSIAEARQLSDVSVKQKVATQMGNQGHSGEGYRRLCEYIWAGAIGSVSEVYCWSDRANGGVGPRPAEMEPPKGMNWENWIGPAPFRKCHKDLHPHEWHGWHDFGGGSLGNMGAHVLDGAHWALKLGAPQVIEVEEMVGGSDERFPLGVRIRYEFAAREGMPPVKLWWFDGKKKGAAAAAKGPTDADANDDTVDAKARNKPPIVDELEKKYNTKLDSNGTVFVGDKGIMVAGTYGGGVRMLPDEAQKKFPPPAKTIERVSGGHHGNYYNAIRTGTKAVSNFETAARLTEIIILGGIAMRTGKGKRLEWNTEKAEFANSPEATRLVGRENRKGWEA